MAKPDATPVKIQEGKVIRGGNNAGPSTPRPSQGPPGDGKK